MSKAKAAPIVHTERLLALVPYITTHQGISLKELSATFGVSTAAMTSDLTTLWMCGLPGYTALELMDLSFDSGYVTIQNASTLKSPRTLLTEEVIALLLGLDLVKESLDANSDIQGNIQNLIERLTKKAGIAPVLSASNPVSGTTRAAIELAISRKQLLAITYHSLYSDSVTSRNIEPLEMQIDNGVEYLFAYCRLAQDFRVFRLDRVITSEKYENDVRSTPRLDNRDPRNLQAIINFTSRLRLNRERFAVKKVVEGMPNHIHFFSPQWLMRNIFASSGSAQVVEPLDLRTEIASRAQLMLDRYEKN